ncbi:Ubiquitin carboxyl-terminal hydrolase family protein [Apiospora saccharicola]|uniref:Ubiquitin carboxyl-terminal hydrolase family protein n=1 Tax=Apiospora saccharicola TaxID=335842 RepID=A0ABR1W5Z8_9PEZI
MADTLPTPRALLTSLINTLSSIPPSSSTIKATTPSPFLPPTQARPLLATLHTLYPSVLLPALDLLDRRLVTRIIPVHNGDAVAATTTAPAQQDVLIEDEADEAMSGEEDEKTHQEPNFYLVRSAQQPSRRGRRAVEVLAEGGGGAGPTYVVQTRAWNCSCAAFAFSAFPAESDAPVYRISSSSSSPSSGPATSSRSIAQHDKQENDDAWEFGGMSRDGLVPAKEGEGGAVGTGGVPCCKHLLACVLAERWQDVMGGYVAERRAGKEEAAGLVAGI